MTEGYRPGGPSPVARLPQLLVSIACSLVAFTGVWLWWFGEVVTGRVATNQLTDPYTTQIWMRRLHSIGSYALVVLIVFMILRAARRNQGWRMIFLFAFLVALAVGFWAGYTADWPAAQLWSETVGTKISAGIDIGDGPPLPQSLQRARVHLSIVPAALGVVSLMSLYHYRRS